MINRGGGGVGGCYGGGGWGGVIGKASELGIVSCALLCAWCCWLVSDTPGGGGGWMGGVVGQWGAFGV